MDFTKKHKTWAGIKAVWKSNFDVTNDIIAFSQFCLFFLTTMTKCTGKLCLDGGTREEEEEDEGLFIFVL